MTTHLLDTDTFSLFLQNDVNVMRAVVAHPAPPMAVSIITVQEVWNGWATAIARAKTADILVATYARLTETVNELRNWTGVPFPLSAVVRYNALKQQKLNVGSGATI